MTSKSVAVENRRKISSGTVNIETLKKATGAVNGWQSTGSIRYVMVSMLDSTILERLIGLSGKDVDKD